MMKPRTVIGRATKTVDVGNGTLKRTQSSNLEIDCTKLENMDDSTVGLILITPPLKGENPGNSPNLRSGVLIFSVFSAKFGLRGLNLGPFFGPLK